MSNYTTIRFGLGEVISDRATSGEFPAVTLEPAKDDPGEVGKKGPDLPLSELRDGSTVLEFHGIEGAKVLIGDIVASLVNNGADLSEFLAELSANAIPVGKAG